MASLYRIDLLGGLRVALADREITRFRTEKTALLLAYLAYHAPRACPRDHLVDLLWDDANPDTSRQSLRTALSSLRRQLEAPGVRPGTIILSDRSRVSLNAAHVTVDVALFRNALRAAGQAESPIERALRLAEAVSLYEGELLAGYRADWLVGERQHVASLFLQACDGLITYYESEGDYTEAMEYAQRALAADPLREESHRGVIRLHRAMDQPQLALQHFHQWEEAATRELGTAPDPATRALINPLLPGGQRLASRARPEPPHQHAAPGAVQRVLRHVVVGPRPRTGEPRARPHAALTTASSDTVTFMLADIEHAARTEMQAGDSFRDALAEHRRLLRAELARFDGRELRETGGGFTAAFASSTGALRCAVAIQTAAVSRACPEGTGALPVRIAIHTGDVTPGTTTSAAALASGDARAVQQVAGRMLLAAHGGQILCSEATAALLRDHLDASTTLVDLGVHQLSGGAYAQRLYQVQYLGMPRAEFPPLQAEAAYASNIPARVSRFFGREEEVERLRELLLQPDSRLVTLVGPGGCGKTCLALEVARRLLDDLHGAVWFVPLADLRDASGIPDALVDALNLPRAAGGDPIGQIINMLSRMPALLVLDNLEQIAQPGREVIARFLERAPLLTCLVTSRRSLEIPSERLFPVPPLPIPSGRETPERLLRCPSVGLFIDRAQAVRPDYQVTPANAAAVSALCARLEGIPLAIELVAARIPVMSASQMLDHLSDRLDWQARAMPDRHRTLRATMDWSHRLLDPEFQILFERLSVFRGGWSLDAAAAVCLPGAAPPEERVCEALSQLQAHSLVRADDYGTEVRFRMLETVREYAGECLLARGEADAVSQRHAAFYLALAEEADTNLQGWEKQARIDKLDVEHDNLLAALSWSADAAPELECRLAGALGSFWEMRGYSSEGRRRLEAVLARGAALPDPIRNKVLLGAARLAWYQGDFPRAAALLEDALAAQRRAGDREGEAAALIALGDVAHRRSELERAYALFRESLAIARDRSDNTGIALALYRLAMATSDGGDHEGALAMLNEGLEAASGEGDRNLMAAILAMRGHALFRLGRFDESKENHLEALALAEEVGDHWARLFVQWGLSLLLVVRGDVAQAKAIMRQGMPSTVPLANPWVIAYGLEAFGYIAAASGELEPAVRHFGAATALRTAIGAPLPPANLPDLESTVAGLRMALGEETFNRFWAEGQGTPWEQAVTYAVEGW